MMNFVFGGKIEATQNNNYRLFHMRHRLMIGRSWYSSDIHSNSEFKDALPCTKTVFDALVNVPGIKEVTVRPYEFSIIKAKSYTWEELTPKIAAAVVRYLPVNRD